ncbi:MAG: dihydropteroate synthase [Aestuariivirga sp.]|uniref:dihydropteroate synthase n=1 Tax=Aestuariivirga sp. TaxID=2650926 RepID=UPI0025C4D0F6|nr:dihydropteroate synthase [Aestuariivirga sp.]MCA3561208.1 dihydropteroate synthase [Aestuariivirga sp.]
MSRRYTRPAGLVYGSDARQLIKEGRGASLGGLSAIAYTLVEEIARGGAEASRRFAPGTLPRQTVVPPFLSTGRPLIMGIVNVTPDSFSDGGLNAEAERAIAHGLQLAKDGADILDVGGESTRPGSEGVPEAEELRRVLPVIAALAAQGFTVSVDTRKANVMRAAIDAGAKIVNDVAALTYEPAAMQAMAEATCPVILMHAQGDPKTMQLSPQYDDVALDVFDWLEARIGACIAAGIARERIVADPGIGFGKSFRHNIDVLRQFTLYHALGVPLLMGLSRKGFIGALTGEKHAGNRVNGSVGGAVWAALNGAHILRVHDVKATVEALAVAGAAADPDQSGL